MHNWSYHGQAGGSAAEPRRMTAAAAAASIPGCTSRPLPASSRPLPASLRAKSDTNEIR